MRGFDFGYWRTTKGIRFRLDVSLPFFAQREKTLVEVLKSEGVFFGPLFVDPAFGKVFDKTLSAHAFKFFDRRPFGAVIACNGQGI